jgi:hypothetical protein
MAVALGCMFIVNESLKDLRCLVLLKSSLLNEEDSIGPVISGILYGEISLLF